MAKFRREYSLLIGDPGKEGLLISDLNIDFKIKKDKKSSANELDLTIYNLSDEKLKSITEDSVLILNAGYKEEVTLLFTGEVSSYQTVKKGSEIKTMITAKDGWVPLREGFTNRTFPAGSTVKDIITIISLEDLKLGQPTFNNGKLGDSAGINKVYEAATTYALSSKAVIEDICRSNRLEFHIQDNKVIIQDESASTQEDVVAINADSGLIGSVVLNLKSTNKLKQDSKPNSGIKFSVLLDGNLRPGAKVLVSSVDKNLSGSYIIDEISHKGQYEGKDWTTMVEALEEPNE